MSAGSLRHSFSGMTTHWGKGGLKLESSSWILANRAHMIVSRRQTHCHGLLPIVSFSNLKEKKLEIFVKFSLKVYYLFGAFSDGRKEIRLPSTASSWSEVKVSKNPATKYSILLLESKSFCKFTFDLSKSAGKVWNLF